MCNIAQTKYIFLTKKHEVSMSNMFAYVKVICVPPHGKWTLTWNSHITRPTQCCISFPRYCHVIDVKTFFFNYGWWFLKFPVLQLFFIYFFIISVMREVEGVDNLNLQYMDFWVIRINQAESYDERIIFYIEVSKETS